MRGSRLLERLIDRIETDERLDRPAAALAGLVQRAVRPGVVEDTLSGTAIGHPVHPAIVAVPIGAWTSSLVLDASGQSEAARRLVALGVLTALPAAATGASDWASTHGAEQRVGFVHAVANYTAIGLYGLSWRARATGSPRLGVALSIAGAGVLGAAGWLGGRLAFAQGVGVDTTAFQQFPDDWVDALGADELPADGGITHVEVAGIPLLLATRGTRVTAMADRCTHRGAPLHDGEVVDGCIVCPWHDSAFALDDGRVTAGPATRPQPMFETRVEGARVQVRRLDPRALRANPVGR